MYKQCILFLLVGLIAGGSSSNAGRWSKREVDPSYEGVSSLPSNGQNQDASSLLEASEIVSDNGLLEKINKWKEQVRKDLDRLRLICPAMGASTASVSPSSPNEQNQDYAESASPMSNSNENETDSALEKIMKEKERLRNALDKLMSEALVASGSSSNARRWSKRETDPSQVPNVPIAAYDGVESFPPSSEQNQDSSSLLKTSEIGSDNGLLEKINQKKEQIKINLNRLRLICPAMGASTASVSPSSPNEQNQDYAESASPMSNSNENETDSALEKIMKEKERLRNALDKYADVINTCRREINLSKDDILFSKKQIDMYITQQKNHAEELQKQIL